MAVDPATGLESGMGVSVEMMAHPDPRQPLIAPDNIPEELRDELEPAYARSMETWGTVPRFFQMLGYAPGAVEGWLTMDQKIRIDYLDKDPDYVRLQELLIVKTALLNECNN
jgi:hypothetical protein